MYDVIDIKNRLWKSFKQSAPTIMELAQERIVAMGNKSGYDPSNITFRGKNVGRSTSYQLAQKIQDNEGIEQRDVTDGYEISKTIDNVPYAALHEYGHTGLPITSPAQRKAMFATMKAMGIYDRNRANLGNASGKRVYPARQYVHKGLGAIKGVELSRIIIREIQKEFNKETVIVIGDK